MACAPRIHRLKSVRSWLRSLSGKRSAGSAADLSWGTVDAAAESLYGQDETSGPAAGEAIMPELTVLSVPDCPNEPVLVERLAEVLADHPGARLARHVVQDEADAARLGMRGSPTLLVNGVDPFGAPDAPASVSCRIYRDETGQAGGAPSVA